MELRQLCDSEVPAHLQVVARGSAVCGGAEHTAFYEIAMDYGCFDGQFRSRTRPHRGSALARSIYGDIRSLSPLTTSDRGSEDTFVRPGCGRSLCGF